MNNQANNDETKKAPGEVAPAAAPQQDQSNQPSQPSEPQK
jgi:hypothetical protein